MSLCATQLRLYPVAKTRSLQWAWQAGAPKLIRARLRAECRSLMVCASANATPGWTIVGGGRVGEALARMGENDVIVRRGEAIPSGRGPIIVATRNDDLDSVIEATPSERRPDLVFIQNGMLEPFLNQRGLGDNTQVLVYLAVAKRGDAPQDGGLTQAHGPHADAFAERLTSNSLVCTVPDRRQFRQSMLEKLVWISAYMLVGARHKVNVGGVEQSHREEVDALVDELAAAGAAELGMELAAGEAPLPERLAEYSRSVSGFPTAVKEFVWRNGWFWGISQARLAAGQSDPCPRHTALLKDVAPQLVA